MVPTIRLAGKREEVWLVRTVSPTLTLRFWEWHRVTKFGLRPSQSIVPVSPPVLQLDHHLELGCSILMTIAKFLLTLMTDPTIPWGPVTPILVRTPWAKPRWIVR
jgi:hypothetical protein